MKNLLKLANIWTVVIIANIEVIYFWASIGGIQDGFMLGLIIAALLFTTIIPVIIAKSNFKFKSRFGFGIPIILTLLVGFFIYDASRCTGIFCGIGSASLAYFTGIAAIIFPCIYLVTLASMKQGNKILLVALLLEAILPLISIILLLVGHRN